MTNQQAYEELTNKHVHWDRKDSNHIVVWTNGYKTMEHYNIEKFLMLAGMHMISETFDQMCGKTMAVYKHN